MTVRRADRGTREDQPATGVFPGTAGLDTKGAVFKRAVYAAVRVDVGIARQALPAGLLVSGLVYDVNTGLIEVVIPPTTK